jgi:hypothetical protein
MKALRRWYELSFKNRAPLRCFCFCFCCSSTAVAAAAAAAYGSYSRFPTKHSYSLTTKLMYFVAVGQGWQKPLGGAGWRTEAHWAAAAGPWLGH